MVTDWTPILTDSDMTVCLDMPYLGHTVLVHIEIYKFTSFHLALKVWLVQELPVPLLFWNKWFPCLTKIKIIFPMFPVARNFICFPVPLRFGHLFSCSPEINVILLFPHTLGGSKQTVLLVYVLVNSKTAMHHTRIWLTGKFNTPALGKIETVQCRAMH